MQRDVEVVINIYMYCLGKCVWLRLLGYNYDGIELPKPLFSCCVML